MVNCQTCKHWVREHGSDSGDCRRRSPRLIVAQFQTTEDGDTPDADAIWPIVDATDWCGEWEPIPLGWRPGDGKTLGCTRAHGDPHPPHSTVEPTTQPGAIPDGQADDPETVAGDSESHVPGFEGGADGERKGNQGGSLPPKPADCR